MLIFLRFPIKTVWKLVSEQWFIAALLGCNRSLFDNKPEPRKDFSACYLLTGLCSLSSSIRCHGGGSCGVEGRMASKPDCALSCLAIHWLIDPLITGNGVATRETNALPLSDELQVPYFGLPNQMSDSPLCLCRAEMNEHAGTSAACANKDLNTEQTAPPSPLCACDHQIIAGRGRSDLQVWGMGRLFPVGTYPVGLTPPLLHQEFPSSQWLCLNEFTEY